MSASSSFCICIELGDLSGVFPSRSVVRQPSLKKKQQAEEKLNKQQIGVEDNFGKQRNFFNSSRLKLCSLGILLLQFLRTSCH